METINTYILIYIFKPDEINNISTIYIYIYLNIIIPIINLYIMSSSRSMARTHKSGSETAREPIVSNRLWNSTGNLPKQKYPQTNDVGSSTKHFKSMQRQLRKREKLLKQMARVEKSMKNAQENIMRKHGIKNKDLGKSTGGHTLPPSWRALDPEYVMNSPGVTPLISSGYSQTARFKTYSQFSLDYTANCPERPKFAKLERIIDGKNKKQSAEFTLFVEAAHRLGINLNAVGHIE